MKKHMIFFIVFISVLTSLFLLESTSLAYAEEVTVEIIITKESKVDNNNIFLKDIALIKSSDPETKKKTGSILLGKAPMPGKTRFFDKGHVQSALKRAGFNFYDLSIDMPEKIKITRNFIRISEKKIEKIVENYIKSRPFFKNNNSRIKEIRVSNEVLLPKGRVFHKVMPLQKNSLAGSIPVSIIFSGSGNFKKRVWSTVKIEVLTEVAVAKRPMGKHKIITRDDIGFKKVDLLEQSSNVITDYREILGKRTRKTIRAGTVLRSDIIELPPLVKRGDLVLIVAESGSLRITAMGEARGKGGMGERIKVVNMDSGKRLYATVKDSKTVEVDF